MSLIMDVRTVDFDKGQAKMNQVAWSAIPLFFTKYGNDYIRSGIF